MLHLQKLAWQVSYIEFFFGGERQNIVAKNKAVSVKADLRERRQRKSNERACQILQQIGLNVTL